MNQFNLSALATSAGVLGLVKALQSLYAGLANVAKQSLQNYAHFESMQKGLETFFQSADKGKAKFEELRKLSNTTTFGVDELANSFTQLANVGVNVDTINDKLVMLGNIAGGDKQKFADLVGIYSKIMSTGKAGSMQIQQLAMRGVPIYDMLKKIGVQGTATGNDITKAFQEMTKEGGQFYNAMNNINETIEGKEGFISDYFKEMMVNFAEVTGLADAYKTVLDSLKEIIGNVSDKLLEWNENPVAKAILQGTIVAAIVAITGAITGMLIPALASVLSLLVAINPAMAIGAGIGALIGVATGGAIAIKGILKDIKNDSKEINQIASSNISGVPSRASAVDTSSYSTNKIVELMKEQIAYENKIDELNSKLGTMQSVSVKRAKKGKSNEKLFADADKIVNEIEKIQGKIKELQKEIDELTPSAMKEKAFNDWRNLADGYKKIIDEAWDDSKIKKKKEEMEELKKSINSLNEIIKFGSIDANKDYLGTSRIEEAKEMLREYENELRKLNGLAELKTWRQYWKEVTGAQIGDIEIKGMNGEAIGNATVEQLRKQYNASVKAAEFTGLGDKKSVTASMKQQVLEMIQQLLSHTSLSDENFAATDNSIKALKKFAEELDDTSDTVFSFNEWIEKMKSSGNAGDYALGTIASSAVAHSGDASAFMEGMQNGGWIAGLIEMFVNALMNVASSLDDFDTVMNPVTTLFEVYKPILQTVIHFLSNFLKFLMPWLELMVSLLSPITDFLSLILELLGGVLKAFGAIIKNFIKSSKWLTDLTEWFEKAVDTVRSWFSWADDILESEKDITDATADLTEGYRELLQAMKENQEYYEKRKKELNSAEYASKVTKVNDMILTPQGQFSTAPDDYIIATKNPNNLGGSSVVTLQPIIKNTIANQADVNVSTQTDENGLQQLVVEISRKIASDYSSGSNGWDSALSSRALRANGRSLTM